MRTKRASLESPFIVKRINYFSDTQYNTLVKSMDRIERTGTGKNSKVVITTSDSASMVMGLIRSRFGGNTKLDSERSVDFNNKNNKISIHFNEGGAATWYANELQKMKSGGLIKEYDVNNPLRGQAASGIWFSFDTVENNPKYKSGNTGLGSNVFGSIPNSPQNLGGVQEQPKSGTVGSMSTYIIIGAVALVFLLFVFKKKKE